MAVGADDDDARIERFVEAAAGGDEPAWQALWALIEPRLERVIAQPRFLGRLGTREDDRRNIIVDVMARLRRNGGERLRLYLAARRDNPKLELMAWLRVVTKRVGIDYMRAHPDYVDRRREAGASRPGRWVEAEALPPASRIGGGPAGMTARGTAGELMRYAAELPEAQRRALELWVQSEPFAEIARELGMAGAADAERAVRAALERLRRRFRDGGGAGAA
jgi:DNA-directed RNA polymerase specialized sigma24 family protein